MRPPGSPEVLERRRQRAIALLREGLPPVEVARRLGVERRSVRRWHARYKQGGAEALAAQPATGRPPKLDVRSKTQLQRSLLRGARACGYPTDLWTCPRVAEVIQRQFGVRYNVDHIGRLLHALGWSPQKPERRARERDEKAIQRWVKETWPRVKKKPNA